MTGNWFALIALLAWPLVTAVLYNLMPFARATIWTILGGYLFLPSEASIKFQMIPAFDKYSIPSICALIGCIVCSPTNRIPTMPKLCLLVTAVYIFSPLVTSGLNNDPIFIGGSNVIPGVDYYDGVSSVLSQILYFLPFLLGWRYLRNPVDIETILKALMAAGLFYSLPTLFEIRMSPQLSVLIYDVFPSSFVTEAKYGGFRPVVFLPNGLALAFFLMTSALAALALWCAKSKAKNIPFQGAAAYLAAVVVLTKSAGALVYTVVGGALVGLSTPRLQARIAIALVAIGLFYPLLRQKDVFPTNTLVNLASAVNEERGGSLQTRFVQEDLLLARASERIWFGWGRFGRSRIYNRDTGSDISLSDGLWIITIGQYGIVGLLAMFAIHSIAVFRAARALGYADRSEQVLLSSLALIVALTVIEQLPNASISPWSWLLTGALLAKADVLQSPQRQPLNSNKRSRPQPITS
jgi:hypothetical protein